MKYKVGDKVRLKKELKQGAKYNGILFEVEMEKFKEKIGTIDCINEMENTYKIGEFYDCWYSEEMLEPVDEYGLENLKDIRKEKGLSQMKVASMVGVSLTAYIRWENGCGKPTPENLEKLEKVLK